MRKITILSIIISLLLITLSLFSPGIIADDTDEIPPLTIPPTNPTPNAKIDVFDRLESLKQDGYLKDKTEIIEDNYSGILVAAKNVKALAQKIKFFCENIEIHEKYRANGLNRASCFDINEMGKSYEALFDKILNT